MLTRRTQSVETHREGLVDVREQHAAVRVGEVPEEEREVAEF